MSLFNNETCVQFVERTDEQDYIMFNNDRGGCYSYLGKQGGGQVINFRYPECMRKTGTIQHEMMHALGFIHEQSRPDRDEYVTIHWENVDDSKINLSFSLLICP